VLEFLSQMKTPNLKIANVKGEGIFECCHFGQNGSRVFGAKRLFLASVSCVTVFRSTFRAVSFQDLHWLQKLRSCKASFGVKVF